MCASGNRPFSSTVSGRVKASGIDIDHEGVEPLHNLGQALHIASSSRIVLERSGRSCQVHTLLLCHRFNVILQAKLQELGMDRHDPVTRQALRSAVFCRRCASSFTDGGTVSRIRNRSLRLQARISSLPSQCNPRGGPSRPRPDRSPDCPRVRRFTAPPRPAGGGHTSLRDASVSEAYAWDRGIFLDRNGVGREVHLMSLPSARWDFGCSVVLATG